MERGTHFFVGDTLAEGYFLYHGTVGAISRISSLNVWQAYLCPGKKSISRNLNRFASRMQEDGACCISRSKKRMNWTDKETKALLRVWKESIHDLRSTKRNERVFEKMAQRLSLRQGASNGASRTPIEIRIKVKNLSAKYREELAKTESAGGNPSSWIYFSAVNSIIGQQQARDCYDANSRNTNPSTMQILAAECSSQHAIKSELEERNEEEDISNQPSKEPSDLEFEFVKGVTNTAGDNAFSTKTNHNSVKRKMCCSFEQKFKALTEEIKRSNEIAERFEGKYLQIAERTVALEERSLCLEERMLSLMEKLYGN